MFLRTCHVFVQLRDQLIGNVSCSELGGGLQKLLLPCGAATVLSLCCSSLLMSFANNQSFPELVYVNVSSINEQEFESSN